VSTPSSRTHPSDGHPDWRPQDTLALARLQQYQLSLSLGEVDGLRRVAAVYGPGVRSRILQDEHLDSRGRTAHRADALRSLICEPTSGTRSCAITAPVGQLLRVERAFSSKMLSEIGPVFAPRSRRSTDGSVRTTGWSTARTRRRSLDGRERSALSLQYPPLFTS